MITFDPIPNDLVGLTDFIDTIFFLEHDYETEKSLGANFEQLDYDSPYLLENMGSLTIVMMVYIALIPLIFLLSVLCWCNSKVKSWLM